MTAQASSMSPQQRNIYTLTVCRSNTRYPQREVEEKKCRIMRQRKMETDWPCHRQGEMPSWVSSTLQKKAETGGGVTGEGQNQPKEKKWWTWASEGNGKVVTENCKELEGLIKQKPLQQGRRHEAFSLMGRIKDVSSPTARSCRHTEGALVGTHHLSLGLKGGYNKEQRASSCH